MLVRVILYTLILGGTVAVNLSWGTPEELGGPYVTLLFVFIAGMYLLSLVHVVLLRLIRRTSVVALVQIATDLVASAVLVHFTGGADSAFVLFFLLSPIAASVTVDRRAAMLTAMAGTVLFTLVLFLGHWLPALPGQIRHAFAPSIGPLLRSILVNSAAMFTVAILSGYLAEQLRFAAEKMEVQQAFIDDLAALNADIIRCLTSGLITIDTRGLILAMNRAAAEILRAKDRPVGGEPLASIAPELAALVEPGSEIRRTEVWLQQGEPKAPLLLGVSVSRLTDHRNTTRGSIINIEDLTSRHAMETAVKRSEHLASLGRMAAGMAHEIRNPLASISGSLELLRTAPQLEPDDRKLMEIALREIERLNSLITDFLAYARPRPPQLELLDLGREIPTLVGTIAGLLAGEQVPTVTVTRTEEHLWVRADRDQLSAVLWNLIRNAWEAGEQRQVSVEMVRSGAEVTLAVIDGGCGIAKDHLGHIFEPFFSTKEKGTGLGLATVHRIVQEHGGSIDVRSQEKQGTTFTIRLPGCPPPASA